MRHIRAICFDLDDTLWDLAPVIPRAERRLHGWFAEHYPRITEVYTVERLHALRQEIGARYPELRHDLTELRLRMLRRVFIEAGYDEAPADDAFAVFQRARNDVELFADVLPALEALAGNYRLYAFSNGNASLDAIGIARWFDGAFTARELGVAKPDTEFFVSALEQAGEDPAAALHVGDHPENDIVAAQRAGMTTLWLNRTGAKWPAEHGEPHHELPGLEALPELLQA